MDTQSQTPETMEVTFMWELLNAIIITATTVGCRGRKKIAQCDFTLEGGWLLDCCRLPTPSQSPLVN